ASASLAGTFNQLALDIHAARPGLGLLFAILVLLFGHAINLAIGLMSGVVHGLRLNYIEFFGWGLGEEGYPFRPFAKREKTA
ncbi:MAG: V-type ATP synthase subunit I, partial [Rhodobacteraceae bacterium]